MTFLRDIERAARLAGIAAELHRDHQSTPHDLEEIAPGIYGPRRPGRKIGLQDLTTTARTIRRLFRTARERFEDADRDTDD